MTRKAIIKKHKRVWQGVTLQVGFEADWLNSCKRDPDYGVSHLEIRVIAPKDAIIPITETGYRSHFEHPSVIEEAGGPVAFVEAWLNEAAKDKKWLKRREAWRQFSLF